MQQIHRFAGAIAATAIALSTVQASAVELIVNGDFETGDFTGWQVLDQAGGSGSFFIDDNDGATPFSALSTVGPASGSFYAVSDQTGPGAHVILQSFTVPIDATSVIVSFDWFVNDYSAGLFIDPAGLDYTVPINQFATFDILTAAADPFGTDPSESVFNLLEAATPTGPNPYLFRAEELFGIVTPGATYQLRIGEVDNQGNLNFGVDNVSVSTDGIPLPPVQASAPATLALMGAGLISIAGVRRRIPA